MIIALNGTAYDELSSGARDRFLHLYAEAGKLSEGEDRHRFIIYSPREFSLEAAFRGPLEKGGRTPFSPDRPLARFLWSRGWFRRRLCADRADLFITDHFPVIRPPRGPEFGTLLTIHDLRYLALDDAGSLLRRAWFRARYASVAGNARAVVTVSNTMRAEILTRLRLPEERVHVVPNGVPNGFRRAASEEIESVRRRWRLPSEHLLCVGVLERRKNLDLLLDLYGIDAGGKRELPPLVIAGRGGPEEAHLRNRVASEGLGNRVRFVGYVPESDLAALFSSASALLMPSIYEGFGIPILQAFACGTPVVCSDRGAIREVAGDAALLGDPGDPGAWHDAVLSILGDGDLRSRLATAGRARADRYSWTAAARALLGVLDTL